MEVNGLDIVLIIERMVQVMVVLVSVTILVSMTVLVLILSLVVALIESVVGVVAVVGFEELCDENVLLGLIQSVLHVVQKLGHTDVIVFQELDDVHLLAITCHTLGHVGVLLKELCD